MIFEAKTQKKNIKLIYAFLTLLIIPLFTIHVSAEGESGVVIYQIQAGASGSATQEYLSIYNNSENEIDVTGWCVVYSSASNATQNELACFTPPDSATKLLLPGHASVTFASDEFLQANLDTAVDYVFDSGISGTSGHIKLINGDDEIIDQVGWGSAVAPEGISVQAPASGKILQRKNLSETGLQDTNNNSADFLPVALTIKSAGNLVEEIVEVDPEGAAIILSEVLPNAPGTDTGKEYIEFYNPSESDVNLKDFKLEIGPDFTKSYTLPDALIPAESYLALNDSQTGIILPNTSVQLRLASNSGNIVSTMDAYDSPDENEAWALIDGTWKITLIPTPGAENKLLIEPKKATSSDVKHPAPCKPDQYRNPETGRCKKLATISKTACKPDQVRNPETGRCKKAEAAGTQKPCPAGQERNAETKRCRKKVPNEVAHPPEVKDVKTSLIENNFKWWAAGFAATGSAGYAGYEWRRELLSALSTIKGKILPG